jgi:hypothetical protein
LRLLVRLWFVHSVMISCGCQTIAPTFRCAMCYGCLSDAYVVCSLFCLLVWY